ncbi:MAG: hypothetical protein AAGG07_00650 [Planctomycetota bacterium]
MTTVSPVRCVRDPLPLRSLVSTSVAAGLCSVAAFPAVAQGLSLGTIEPSPYGYAPPEQVGAPTTPTSSYVRRYGTPYVRVGAALGFADDLTADSSPPTRDPDIDTQIVWGANFATGLRWDDVLKTQDDGEGFGIDLRADLEFAVEAIFYNGSLVPPDIETDDDGVIYAWLLTLNGFADIDLPGPVSLFGGGGVGPALITRDEDDETAGDESAVVQWMAGLLFDIDNTSQIYLAYRERYYLTDPSFDGIKVEDLNASSIELGWSIAF